MGRYERLKTEIESGNGAQPLSESRYERLKKEMGESSSVSSTKTKKTKKPAPSSLDNRPKSETKKTTAAPPAPAPAKARKTNSGAVTKKSPVYIRSTKAAPAVDPSAYGYDPMVAQDLQNRAAQSKPGVAQAMGTRRGGQTVYRVDDAPSLGSRVAGTVSGAAKTYGGSMAGLGAFALEAVKKLDESVSTSHRRAVNDAEHAREARLKLLSDSVQRRHGVGAPMTQEERDRLRKQAELDEARVRLAQEYQDKVHAPLTAASDALYRKGAEMEAAGQEDIERAKAGLGAVGRFGVDVGVAGLQMGMDYIPALLTGGSSALAPMFLRSAGGAAITGKESGADFSDRAVYALGSGALSAVTEQISNIAGPFRKMFGVGVADRIASRLVSRFGEKQTVQIMSRAAQTAAGRAALSAFGEGFEEVAEAVLQTPLQKATIDPDAKFDPVQAGYDFLVGAALGGLGGVSDTVLRNPGTQTQAPVSPETRAAEIQSIQEQAEQEAADWIESLNIPRPVDINAVNAQADQDASAIVRDMFSQKPVQPTSPESVMKIIQDIQREQQARPGSILLNGDQLTQINQEIAKQQAAPVDVDSLLKGRARLDYEQLSPDTQAAVDRAYEQGTAGMDAEGRIFRINPEDHIDRRDAADVGRRRSLNAFQFDHPELHRFFAGAAQWLKSGMGQKGGQIESTPGVLSDGVTPSSHDRYWRTSRMQPEPVVRLLDEFGLSYAEIDKALDAIIKDRGQENYAAAKKVELVLDEMLTNGWTDLDGRYLPGIPEYVDATSKIAGSLNAEQEPDLGIMGREIERLYGKSDTTPSDGLGAADAGTVNTDYDRLQAQSSEFHPEGENPARPVDVPVRDFDGRNIPKAASTVTGAEILNNADVERLQQIIADGMISFDTIHDTDAQSAARQTVSEIGFEGALERYRQAAGSNVATKNNVALGQLLMDLAAQSGNESALAEIFYLYTTNSTNIAQAMQAQAMLRKLSPESQLSILQKSVNRLNEKYGTDAEISGENMRDFLNAPDEKTRREVADRIVKDAAQSVPGTFRAKYDCLRYLAMLGNPRTHIRNILGNTLFQIPVTAKNRVGAAVEAGYNFFSGGRLERTKSLTGVNPASQLAKECRADWSNVSVLSGSKYSEGRITARDIESEIDPFQNSNPLFKGLGKLSDMNGQLLSAEDTAAKRWIYTQSLAGYLKANGIKSISEADPQLLNRARNYAAQEAMRNTFNDHNAFSDFVAKLSALPNSENKWARRAGYVTEGLLPFKRTPANILSRAVEYSPVGAAASIADLVNRGVRGQATVESVATGIDRLAAGLTGTVLLAVGFLLNGYFSGGDDEDDKQRDFNSLTGHQSYALELENGTSVTLDWLAPEAIPFFMGVELAHAWQDGGLSWEDALNALKNMSGPMLEMSMLQGLNDVIEDASYAQYHGGNVPVAFIVSAATNYATQIFPTLFGQLERSTENRRMTTYADKNSPIAKDLQFFLGKTSQKIPGLDYHQIPYIDEWGREESNGDPISRTFNNILNPAYMSRVQIDSVEKELQRLKDASGSSSVFPSRVEKSFKVGDEMKYLTADEYTTFAKTVGQTRRDLLDRLMKQPGYKRLSDEQKAQAVASVYEYATGKGKMEVSKWKPDESSIVKGVLKSMLPVESYILYRLNSDRDKSGSVNGAESALTLLELNGLSNQQRGKAWDALNDIKEDKNPFIGALPEAGVQSKTAIDIYDRYRELNNARMKPKDKAAEFLSYVRGLGLTSEQLKAVKNTYTFFGSYPIEW